MSVSPTESQASPNQEANKPSDKEINFRKQQEMYERKLEQERQVRMELEEKVNRLAQERMKPSEEDDDPSDEPYVDYKRLNRKFSKFEKNMEGTIESKAQQIAQRMIADKEREEYLQNNPDFQEVMNPDVLNKFGDKYPKIGKLLVKMPDTFERQQLVYEAIKALNVHKPVTPEPTIQQKIDANRRSPYYQPSGVSAPPFSGGGDFSQQGQKSSYDKMKELQARMRL